MRLSSGKYLVTKLKLAIAPVGLLGAISCELVIPNVRSRTGRSNEALEFAQNENFAKIRRMLLHRLSYQSVAVVLQ